ncbi:MAG: hypothetical protein HZB26_12775 [Candidatus Hydrogenedentes bacterium]|nr:hypothetical protein [Candidatus Hydrogenedentota bacterium]
MPDRTESQSHVVAKMIKGAALIAASTIAVLLAVATVITALATGPS